MFHISLAIFGLRSNHVGVDFGNDSFQFNTGLHLLHGGAFKHLGVKQLLLEEKLVGDFGWIASVELAYNGPHSLYQWVSIGSRHDRTKSYSVGERT
jgi:hypothetical protein